jgi:hypothetical protein
MIARVVFVLRLIFIEVTVIVIVGDWLLVVRDSKGLSDIRHSLSDKL